MDYIKTGTMGERIANLYESVERILSTHCRLNMESMVICHSIGLNGFKRWHRYRSRQFHGLDICLANELYDKFRISLRLNNVDVNYNPKSLKEHLEQWEKAVLADIQNLGLLNQEYFQETGMTSRIVEKALCKMTRDYEKIGRYYKRFSECQWLEHDIHVVDDRIHEKYKEKEEGHGYKV